VDRIPGPEPEVRLGGDDGSVVVSVQVPGSADEAWRAVTERERIALWLGTLTGVLQPQASLRLDFEDGDFFDIEVVEVDPLRRRLRWTWRFMGCGCREDIEIAVASTAGPDATSVVTVRDSELRRSREASLELAEGWRDFTSRLQRHLATGDRTRYDWRSEVDVSIELPTSADDARRILIPAAAEWLPLDSGENLFTAAALVLDDGKSAATLAIEDVEPAGPGSVRFTARPEGMGRPTTCQIAIEPRGAAATLRISHAGFRELDVPELRRRDYRQRCASAWLAAARHARQILEAHMDSSSDELRRSDAHPFAQPRPSGDCPLRHVGLSNSSTPQPAPRSASHSVGGCPLRRGSAP
jgi:uncharacterized protein YndB with AHSA1/START domain